MTDVAEGGFAIHPMDQFIVKPLFGDGPVMWYTPTNVTLWLFLAVLAIGDDLVDPFANTVHDLPLTAMCRTIEIDLLQAIGEPAPEPLTPVKGVLW